MAKRELISISSLIASMTGEPEFSVLYTMLLRYRVGTKKDESNNLNLSRT